MESLFSINKLRSHTPKSELNWHVKKQATKYKHKYKNIQLDDKAWRSLVRTYLVDCLGGYEGTFEQYYGLDDKEKNTIENYLRSKAK